MITSQYKLLTNNTPLTFTDGTDIYQKLAQNVKTHNNGYFILAPSGAGKTHYVKSQAQPDWLDGDELWSATKALPEGEWWNEPLELIFEIERRCDVITEQAKRYGFWIIGASDRSLKPDAIVIPNWMTHKKWIAAREAINYDGGATTAQLSQVLNHRREIALWRKQNVPQFATVESAAVYLASVR